MSSDTRRFTSFQGSVTVEVNGQSFEGKPLTADQAEPIFEAWRAKKIPNLGRALTAATFGLDLSALGSMPLSIITKLMEVQTEINDLKPVEASAGAVGEPQATA